MVLIFYPKHLFHRYVSNDQTNKSDKFQAFYNLVSGYHGLNEGSALAAMGWLHLSMNRRALAGVHDNIATFNLFGVRGTGE